MPEKLTKPEQGQTIKATSLQKEKEYQQKEITIAKAQEKLADLKPESRKAKKTEHQIRQKQAEQDIFKLRQEIAGLKQDNPELTQKRQELQNAKITAEKEKTIIQKAGELFTNKEVGKRFIVGQISSMASSLGLRTVYSLPTWLWQRANVKGEWGREGLQKHLEKTLEASQKRKNKAPEGTSQKAEMAEMMKIVKMTKEGGQKNSALRQELANTIRKNRAENRNLNQQESVEIKKLIDKHAETKVNGLEVARDGLNSACVAGGAWYLRIFSRGLFDAANRYQRLQREAKPDQEVSFFRDAIAKGVTETFQKAAFAFGKDKTAKQRGLEFAQAASTLMSYYGMGALSLLRPEVIIADIDRVIDTFSGGQNLGQMMENMGQNFFENATIVGDRYLKIAEIAAKPFHKDQAASAPDIGESLAPSEIIKPKPATAEVPNLEPNKIILEERPMVTPKEATTPSLAPEMTTTPPPQQPIEIEKPTMQTIEPVTPEAQTPILTALVETDQPLIQTEHLTAEPLKQEDFSLRQTPSPREMPATDDLMPKPADSLELAQKALHNDILETYGILNEKINDDLIAGGNTLFLARLRDGQNIEFRHTTEGVLYQLEGQNEWQSINDLSDAAQPRHISSPTTASEMATTPPPAETEIPVVEQVIATEPSPNTTELPSESTEPPIKTPEEFQEEARALAIDDQRSESYPIPPSTQPEPSLAEQSQPQPETQLEAPVITDDTANEVIKYFEQNDYKSPLLPLLKENQQIGTLYQEVSLNVEQGNKTAAQTALDQIKSLVFNKETGQDDYNIAGTQNALIKLGFSPKDLANAANGDEKLFALAWENFLKNQQAENHSPSYIAQIKQNRQTAGVLLGQLQTLQAVKTFREGL